MAGYQYGGHYNCAPYQTQFSSVDITPGAVRKGRPQPSSDLMTDAEKLTRGMHTGLDSCSSLMKDSQGASVNARELGQSFEHFASDFGNFASSATKFLTSITYPDFKVATHPKPTFNQVGVWSSMNEDFKRQMESFSVLGQRASSHGLPTNVDQGQMHNRPRRCHPQAQRCEQRQRPCCYHQSGQSVRGQSFPNHWTPSSRGYYCTRPTIVQEPLSMNYSNC